MQVRRAWCRCRAACITFKMQGLRGNFLPDCRHRGQVSSRPLPCPPSSVGGAQGPYLVVVGLSPPVGVYCPDTFGHEHCVARGRNAQLQRIGEDVPPAGNKAWLRLSFGLFARCVEMPAVVPLLDARSMA